MAAVLVRWVTGSPFHNSAPPPLTPPPPPKNRLGLRPIKNFLRPSAPMSLDQRFSSAPSAPLRIQHHWGRGWGQSGPRNALEGKAPQRRPQRRLDRRLEEVAKAVGGGYCRLQMPLKPALGVRGTVAGHRLAALEGEGGYLPGPRKGTTTRRNVTQGRTFPPSNASQAGPGPPPQKKEPWYRPVQLSPEWQTTDDRSRKFHKRCPVSFASSPLVPGDRRRWSGSGPSAVRPPPGPMHSPARPQQKDVCPVCHKAPPALSDQHADLREPSKSINGHKEAHHRDRE